MSFGNMMGSRMVDRFFRRVDDVVWDLMTGRVGIKTKDGIATLQGEGDDAQVSVNLFDDFGVALPAFAQNTPVESIKVGDLIYNDKRVMGWVVSTPAPATKTRKAGVIFKLLKPDGTRGEWRPPLVASLGLDLNGAMVLRSLVNTLPEGGLGNMQSMLLPMMMMGESGGMGDMEEMLPMMLMMQTGMGGTTPDASGNGMAGMMQTMMLMKMLGGKGNSKGNTRLMKDSELNGNFFDNKN